MSYKVSFAGINLDEYCKILNVSRALLPNRQNYSKEVSALHGSHFTGFKYSERIITLEIAILENTKEKYALAVSALAEKLDVKTPSQLIIDDEPYKCYYAVLDGSTDLSKIAQSATANLTFICHDPLAFSTYWNSYIPNEKGIFTLENYGNADTLPLIDVQFSSPGCFVQVTNPLGQTVLIGQPKDSSKNNTKKTITGINDDCTLKSTFVELSESLLDNGVKTGGNFDVGFNGNGIVCSNYGNVQENTWTGTAFKRTLESGNIQDFEVTVDLAFSSEGKNYVPPSPAPPIPQPPVSTPPKKPDPTPKPPSSSLGTWKVVNCGGLWINKNPSVGSPLYAMAPGTYVYPTEIRGNWVKHTHSNKWHTYTGWSSKHYLQKISDKGRNIARSVTSFRSVSTIAEEYAEDQLGLIQIYGFGQNGEKIFRFDISDTNEFFEYVDPRCYISNTLVLDDGKKAGTPRKTTVKENDKEVTKEVASGVFGDFNDFTGQVQIRRESDSKGNNLWSATIRKVKDGKTISSISTSNSLTNAGFQKAPLSYLGFYIGRYSDKTPMSIAAITNIKVEKLNQKTDEIVEENLEIFKENDHLQIDFSTGNVLLNNDNILPHLDIGSEFFTIPPGNSQIVIKSDATLDAVCGFQDRFV